MKDLFRMWAYPRMIALVAVSATAYAMGLYLFSYLLPAPFGLRPAVSLAVVSGIIFGPAGAFAAAIGNFLFDLRNDIDFGIPLGVVGNFLLAYLPYRGVRLFKEFSPRPALNVGWFLRYSVLAGLGALGSGLVIGFALDGLTAAPFAERGMSIILSNFAVALVLGPWLLYINGPLASRGLTYQTIMQPDLALGRSSKVGWGLVFSGAALAILAGLLTYVGIMPSLTEHLVGSVQAPAAAPGMLAGIAVFLIGVILI